MKQTTGVGLQPEFMKVLKLKILGYLATKFGYNVSYLLFNELKIVNKKKMDTRFIMVLYNYNRMVVPLSIFVHF